MRDVPVPSSRCGLADGLPGGVPRTLERWASEQGQVVKVLIKPVHVFNELDSTSCQSPLSSARLGSARLRAVCPPLTALRRVSMGPAELLPPLSVWGDSCRGSESGLCGP